LGWNIRSNTHYDHIHRFLGFIDKWLDVSGPIGRKLLEAKYPFQLEQAAAELETFVHLYERFGTAVQAAESTGNSRVPDLEVRFDAWRFRVEVYTPVDFMGFQLFKRYVPMVLKYLDVSCGYCLKVTTQPLQQTPGYDQAMLYYPYSIPEEKETYQWLAKFSERARQWLSNRSPTQALRMPGPGGKAEIVVEIVKLDSNPDSRQICFIGATQSTDTGLFFEVGTAEDTLDGGKQRYDVVLPTQLVYECYFGRPVWINAHWEATVGNFFAKAGFDDPCVPPPDSTPQEIKELLRISDPAAESTN